MASLGCLGVEESLLLEGSEAPLASQQVRGKNRRVKEAERKGTRAKLPWEMVPTQVALSPRLSKKIENIVFF
jgi:hypothetical protein